MKNGVIRSRNLRINTVSKSNKIPVPIEANENLSSKYMLLEIGYNRNDIEEVRNTAEYFGKILADTLKHEK